VALSQSIEHLYRVFARYRLNAHVEGCPCCVSADSAKALARVPLRDATGDELSSFSFRALTTWGVEADFKHFLPRILELLTVDRLGTDAQIVFGKLPYTDWKQWPEREQQVIEHFAMQWFCTALDHSPHQLLAIVESAGLVGMSVTPMLSAWIATPRLAAANVLADFAWQHAASLHQGHVRFVWWKHGEQEIGQWLVSGAPAKFLEAMVELYGNEPSASSWAQSYDLLIILAPGRG
jgi:hypothetical protein